MCLRGSPRGRAGVCGPSGRASLRIVRRAPGLPAARFVHIVRDGRNTALSMSKHHGFRMVFAAVQLLEGLGVDPFTSDDRRWEEDLTDELAALLPERFTREAFLALSTPPPLCGHYWSGEIREGLAELSDLGPDRLLTLRYEDFLAAPAASATALIAFLRRAVDTDWVTRAAQSARGARSGSALRPRPRPARNRLRAGLRRPRRARLALAEA